MYQSTPLTEKQAFKKNTYVFKASKNTFLLYKSNENDKKILFYKITFQAFHIYSWTLPRIKKKKSYGQGQ